MAGLVIDLRTGTETYQELSAQEVGAIATAQAEAQQVAVAQADAAQQRKADLALIRARAAQDPTFAALLRLLGG